MSSPIFPVPHVRQFVAAFLPRKKLGWASASGSRRSPLVGTPAPLQPSFALTLGPLGGVENACEPRTETACHADDHGVYKETQGPTEQVKPDDRAGDQGMTGKPG
jgi:hypothetical protein